MNAMQALLALVIAYLLIKPVRVVWGYFRDRSGNSGTHGHFDDNRRIDGPDGA
jgi:hypothetical protein